MRVVKNDPSSAITLTTQPNVIPALHWGFAYEQLKNQRDGTKLRYYQKADLIPYSTGLGYDITLSYPVRFHRGKFFLKKNGVYTSDNPPLSYTLYQKQSEN